MRGLLQGAGFVVETVEDVPVLFEYPDIDAYLRRSVDTGGMFARAWNDAAADQRATITARIVDGFEPFAVDGGYELPGVAVVAGARA